MPDCVTCTTLPECNCRADQQCVLKGRSCDSCGENTCIDNPDSDSSGSKGGSGAGATAGGAVGAAIAALILALAVWWFWKRRQRQQYARKLNAWNNNSREKSHGNSSGLKVRFGEDAKAGSSPAPRRSNRMSRSIAMNLEEQAIPAASPDEPTSTSPPISPPSTAQSDNPFDDRNSFLMADELSNTDLARSASHRSNHQPSQQQQAPPAAYIPPHANSMSVADGMERNTLGARRARSSKIDPADKAPPELRISLGALPQTTEQITTQSVASGSSPSTSTPGSNTPGGSRTKMKPSRPTRDGLDLRLPAKPSSDGTSPQSFGVRSSSNSSNNSASPGFPWGSDDPGTLPPPPTTATNSRFSSSTSVGDYSSDGRYSLAPPPSIRPYSTASSAPGSHLSVASHMSYILNPPQIVTATSTGRVGVVGHAVARTVQLGSSAPSTPGAVESLNGDSIPPIPLHQPAAKRDTVSTAASDDPFADEVSAVIGQFPNPLATPTFGAMSSAANTPTLPSHKPSPLRQSAASEENAHRFSRANTPVSVAFSTGPSYRESVQSDADLSYSRPNTMVSNDGRPVSKDSLLDSMPFRAPPPPQAVETRGSFPTQAQSSSNRQTQATLGDLVMEESAAPLPEPNKPFAPGGPPQDRHSNASSLGALENIPFNLGFTGNDRGSMWSDASDGAGLRDSSYTTGHYSASSEAPPVPSVDLATHSRKTSTTRPVSLTQDEGPASQQLSANPTSDKIDDAERLRTPGADGSLQEQQQTTKSEDLEAPKDSLAAPKPSTTTTAGSADHRASVDSFTQNAMLANRFESSD